MPKLMAAGVTANDPGVVPVPLSGMERLGLEALELTERLPLELPAVVGAKMMLKV